jgi:hypothetical protein
MLCAVGLFPASAFASTIPDTPGSSLTVDSASVKTFYPYVKDGYRDTVWFDLTYDAGSDPDTSCWGSPDLTFTVATITNAQTGQIVRHLTMVNEGGAEYWGFSWNGKKDDGTRVKPGLTFNANLQAYDDDCEYSPPGPYSYDVQTPLLTIAGIRPTTRIDHVRRQVLKDGVATASRSHSGACYFEKPGNRDLTLDAWGGSCAAKWVIAVPKGATRVSYRADWGKNDALYKWGAINHSVTRTKTGYRFACSITDWAAFDINAVWVNYTIPRRR